MSVVISVAVAPVVTSFIIVLTEFAPEIGQLYPTIPDPPETQFIVPLCKLVGGPGIGHGVGVAVGAVHTIDLGELVSNGFILSKAPVVLIPIAYV